jgi:hypothetical protein
MTLSIGRRGWTGIAIQSAFNVPAAPTDYIPWETNTLAGMTEQMAITEAHGIRDSQFSSAPGKQSGVGELKDLLDTRYAGYFLAAVLGSTTPTLLTAGVTSHALAVNETNQPLFLSIINNRVVDQEYYPNVAVSSVDLEVGVDLATIDAKLIGFFPSTTTSGSFATTSGNIFSFKNATFGLGATPGAALSNQIKTTSVKLSIDNKTEAVWAHGSAQPYAIPHKNLTVTADIELYFENTTDKLAFYNQSKQAAVLQFNGAGLAGGYTEQLTLNLYQITFKSFAIDTGLDNLQLEKVSISAEYSVSAGKTIDGTLINSNANY